MSAFENVKVEHEYTVKVMDSLKLEREHLVRAMVGLVSGFTWENSKEGHRYWSDVYDKLEYYAELAETEYD